MTAVRQLPRRPANAPYYRPIAAAVWRAAVTQGSKAARPLGIASRPVDRRPAGRGYVHGTGSGCRAIVSTDDTGGSP
jgi:hypothetical protein